MLFLILAAAFLLLALAYWKLKLPLQYWKKKGIPYVKPWIIFGNMGPFVLRTKAYADVLNDAYKQFSGHRYFGFYQFSTPSLVIRDLDLMKQICIKDFDSFTDHTDFLPKTSDPFWKKSLFAREGNDWHDMRAILSPAFTGSKIRAMYGLMAECAQEFVSHFEGQSGIITMDMKDTFSRFANDVIASCAFGIKCDSLKQRDNEFFLMGKSAFDLTGFKSLKLFGVALSPSLMKLFKVSLFSENMKNFFRRVVKETIKHRVETKTIRPDMIHLLLEAQKGRLQADDDNWTSSTDFNQDKISKNYKKPELTDEDIAVQAVLFFAAGYDSVAVLLSNVAYELAVNPEVQDKLTREIDDTLRSCNGKITYEALLAMKYLDMVISEALRLRVALFINRRCVKPYTIEPVLPHEKPLHIEVGTDILIPHLAIQGDEKYFPNPKKFDPERFSDENKNKIPPSAFSSFGIGPRFCIGNRFALLETKTVIFFLLTKFEIVPVEKTQIPFVLSKNNVVPAIANGYWLGLKQRSVV